jgi:hypothetical protein
MRFRLETAVFTYLQRVGRTCVRDSFVDITGSALDRKCLRVEAGDAATLEEHLGVDGGPI